jgi:hypothetical protein
MGKVTNIQTVLIKTRWRIRNVVFTENIPQINPIEYT